MNLRAGFPWSKGLIVQTDHLMLRKECFVMLALRRAAALAVNIQYRVFHRFLSVSRLFHLSYHLIGPEAIEDAKVNSQENHIDNTLFFAGDMKDILTDDFIAEHGRPDVIITDPPRAGMHPDVVKTILKAAPQRIVYVSCNPATQARDLQELDSDYQVVAVQPVDMFPHTPHVENVVLLNKR